MDMSTLSHADLVSELFASSPHGARPAPLHVAEAAVPAAAIPVTDAALSHRLAVARELLLRGLHERMRGQPILSSPQDVRNWLCLYCAGLEREVFLVLYLDVRHRLIESEELFQGTLTQTSVYPRELVKGALSRNAAALVVAHNHPSGIAESSPADEVLTRTLQTALQLIDIRIIDHFIVAGSSVVSFAERGLL
ncbi:DNA repair protein RadC [Pseudothauera nasutitermitis]|uniref:DNA repair protein RadC n=1 Tax=Pseudothauera nasutitermitis TaxID=2565930 RepID=A0A4S4AN68_9RHOO|nr:DNA repair protein RadC [Pseudothauera nasutitermitis]THF61075.1 DNA repair protein RadC [Pseudothauera nasutitermitis]